MAIPQILQQLGAQPNPAIGQIKQMMQAVQSSQNPQAMLQQMAMQNPNVRQAMSLISSMRDPKTAFYALAQQKGVDPQQILDALK